MVNGESQSTTDYITSVNNYWNDGNFYPIKMTNTITDRIHITEVSPPKGIRLVQFDKFGQMFIKKKKIMNMLYKKLIILFVIKTEMY